MRLYYRDAAGKKGTLDLRGPQNVPTTSRESDLGNTFNATLDEAFLRPGLEVYIEVDPDDRVAETDETNNRYPAAGYAALTVQEAPTLSVTLVPVTYRNRDPHHHQRDQGALRGRRAADVPAGQGERERA